MSYLPFTATLPSGYVATFEGDFDHPARGRVSSYIIAVEGVTVAQCIIAPRGACTARLVGAPGPEVSAAIKSAIRYEYPSATYSWQ